MGIHQWRSRVAFVVLSVTLWITVWAVRDSDLARAVVLGVAVVVNVVFAFSTLGVSSQDSFERGESIGKAIGYQAGYRDGMQQGMNLMNGTGPRNGAELIGIDDGKPPVEGKEEAT